MFPNRFTGKCPAPAILAFTILDFKTLKEAGVRQLLLWMFIFVYICLFILLIIALFDVLWILLVCHVFLIVHAEIGPICFSADGGSPTPHGSLIKSFVPSSQ